ncbi:facilitated trehalose transporter Tret1 [Cephus cinctus]|uniref:Facilitated trehalose transporter Tret1 n=1 Tax=Cephus cinctus TaxID=211228 RepID=A0AAJ7FR52_CEPCN|nr:facilitated trehalose transporter Tret1 [Cephus cinctus]
MSLPIFKENERFNQQGRVVPQYLAVVLATMSALSGGTYLGWTSPALPLLREDDHLDINDGVGSWIGSLTPLGALIGALPAGYLADKVGRKRAILIITLPLLFCWYLVGFTHNLVWILLGRALAGTSIGASSVTVPMYVYEISEANIRGKLGTFFQLQLTIGILFVYLTGFTQNYAYIALICALIPALVLITLPFMPESPVWLMNQNRREDAKAALQYFRGKRYSVEKELSELQLIKDSQEDAASIMDLKNHVKAMIIALGLSIFQQLSGINAVIFYSQTIFAAAETNISSILCSVIIGIVQVVATCGSSFFIDHAGRKVLLLLSSTVMAACLFVLSAYFHFQTVLSSLFWVPLVSLTVLVIVFSLGFGPIPWLIVGELFPSNVKGTAGSVAAATNWSLAFMVTKFFPTMMNNVGIAGSFVIFAFVCVAGTIFISTVVPETKGKSLEEVQNELYGIREEPITQVKIQS